MTMFYEPFWETFYTSEVENVADKFQRHMEGGGRSSSRLVEAFQLWFFTLTLTAQNETDDGIAEVLDMVRFDRETNLC